MLKRIVPFACYFCGRGLLEMKQTQHNVAHGLLTLPHGMIIGDTGPTGSNKTTTLRPCADKKNPHHRKVHQRQCQPIAGQNGLSFCSSRIPTLLWLIEIHDAETAHIIFMQR